jgi:hypothetical protein
MVRLLLYGNTTEMRSWRGIEKRCIDDRAVPLVGGRCGAGLVRAIARSVSGT